MSIRVTITKPNVTDAYGLPMVVGSTYTVADDFGLSLISQGKAIDTDASLTNPGVREADALGVVYCNAATIAAPTAQMLASYNTVFALDVAPFTRYRSNGTYLVPEGQYTTDSSGNITGLAGVSGFSGAAFTWASKPSASAAGAGAQITVTDVGSGRTTWYSDGTNWRPVNGSVNLWTFSGSVATPVATLVSAGAAILFGSPVAGLKIPAGMLIPGASVLKVSSWWSKTGSTGGASCRMFIGTNNSLSDSGTMGQFIGAAATASWDSQMDFSVVSSTRIQQNQVGTGKNVATGAVTDQTYTTGINTAANMYLNFGTDSSSSGDGLLLCRLQIQLFQ